MVESKVCLVENMSAPLAAMYYIKRCGFNNKQHKKLMTHQHHRNDRALKQCRLVTTIPISYYQCEVSEWLLIQIQIEIAEVRQLFPIHI